MSRFRFSRSRRDPDDPWFRVGTVDVTTTLLLIGIAVVGGMFVFALLPATAYWLVVDDRTLLRGQVWRVVTWPFTANLSFLAVINLVFFWLFGSELEREIGTRRFTQLSLRLILGLGVLAAFLVLLLGGMLVGFSAFSLMILLLLIAERPHARALFDIPFWVLGAVLVGISLLQYLASRYWFGVVHLLLGLLVTIVAARSVGLLSEASWLPKPGRPRRRRTRPSGGRAPRGGGPTVVEGPWRGSSAPDPVSRDQAELDALLEKIHEHGMDSLSTAEKKHLLVLRDRLRGQ